MLHQKTFGRFILFLVPLNCTSIWYKNPNLSTLLNSPNTERYWSTHQRLQKTFTAKLHSALLLSADSNAGLCGKAFHMEKCAGLRVQWVKNKPSCKLWEQCIEHLVTITFDSCLQSLTGWNGKKTQSSINNSKNISGSNSKVTRLKLTPLSDADMLKFSLKARQMMTNQKPQFGIPLWLWHGFKSWNVHGTPTESGWDVAIKGERKSGKRMEKKDWSSRLMALLWMKIATRNKIHTNNEGFYKKM